MSDKRWARQETIQPPRPCVFIQWKGTDACADLYCECGAQGHIDSDFMYVVRCAGCGRHYDVACFVALIPIPEDEIEESDREWAKVFGEP